MSKGQYVLLASALVLFVSLSFMSTRVVDNEKEQVSEDAEMPNETHTELSDEVLREVQNWKEIFYQSTSQASKLEVLEKLLGVYIKSNRFDSAAKYAEHYATDYPSLQTKLKAGDLYYEAFTFAILPKKSEAAGEKAREFYEAVLAEKPDSLNLKVKIGRTLILPQNPMGGIRMILNVLEEDPTNRSALYNLGLLAIQSNQLEKAEGRFKQILELYPEDEEGLFYLGVIYSESQRSADAVKLFDRLEEISENEAILQAVRKYRETMKN